MQNIVLKFERSIRRRREFSKSPRSWRQSASAIFLQFFYFIYSTVLLPGKIVKLYFVFGILYHP